MLKQQQRIHLLRQNSLKSLYNPNNRSLISAKVSQAPLTSNMVAVVRRKRAQNDLLNKTMV